MNIKEAEERTGITKQNIRFYEKKGLLSPQRNQENSYREYTQEDVETLMRIKAFRKLDISIENIQKILAGEDPDAIIRQHLDYLLEKQSNLDAMISMCRFLLSEKEAAKDATAILQKMEEIEQKGGHFMSIVNDYKLAAAAEAKRTFSFQPDTMVQTPEEFSEALCKYGMENNLNLVLTKGGMYPKFEIDGLEYEASRRFFRFGAVITCKLTDDSLLQKEYGNADGKRIRTLRMIHRIITFLALPVGMFLFLRLTGRSFYAAVLVELIYLPLVWFHYRNFQLK